ncbi:MAG: hypothetical protein ABSG16_21875 [Candidatus Acidiferrum sp.]|jgi:hypothetical protein
MYLPLILALVLSQIPDAPVAKPQTEAPGSQPAPSSVSFELEGDKLGESLAAFKAQHPKAQCDASQKTRTSCYQWAEVAILGLIAHPDSGCNLKKRYAAECLEGLTARFTDERLVSLVYSVAGADRSAAAAALRKKFGAPTLESREATVWNSGNSSASVVAGKGDMPDSAAPALLTISISVTN